MTQQQRVHCTPKTPVGALQRQAVRRLGQLWWTGDELRQIRVMPSARRVSQAKISSSRSSAGWPPGAVETDSALRNAGTVGTARAKPESQPINGPASGSARTLIAIAPANTVNNRTVEGRCTTRCRTHTDQDLAAGDGDRRCADERPQHVGPQRPAFVEGIPCATAYPEADDIGSGRRRRDQPRQQTEENDPGRRCPTRRTMWRPRSRPRRVPADLAGALQRPWHRASTSRSPNILSGGAQGPPTFPAQVPLRRTSSHRPALPAQPGSVRPAQLSHGEAQGPPRTTQTSIATGCPSATWLQSSAAFGHLIQTHGVPGDDPPNVHSRPQRAPAPAGRTARQQMSPSHQLSANTTADGPAISGAESAVPPAV